MQNNIFLENQIKSKKKKNITAKDKEKVKEKLFIQGMLEWKKQKNQTHGQGLGEAWQGTWV